MRSKRAAVSSFNVLQSTLPNRIVTADKFGFHTFLCCSQSLKNECKSCTKALASKRDRGYTITYGTQELQTEILKKRIIDAI